MEFVISNMIGRPRANSAVIAPTCWAAWTAPTLRAGTKPYEVTA